LSKDDQKLNFQVGAGTSSEKDVISIGKDSLINATTASLGLDGVDVTKAAAAPNPPAPGGTPAADKSASHTAIDAIDEALEKVDTARSNLGALQNRFESTINNLNNTINNLSASRSRIEDADYAVEVSNMTRAQILQQAGTSVLAQANQVPQTVLSLLR